MSDSARSCSKDRFSERPFEKPHRQIVLPIEPEEYHALWIHPKKVRAKIAEVMREHPELFPAAMRSTGYP